jgi:hypothetical protein
MFTAMLPSIGSLCCNILNRLLHTVSEVFYLLLRSPLYFLVNKLPSSGEHTNKIIRLQMLENGKGIQFNTIHYTRYDIKMDVFSKIKGKVVPVLK